MKRQYRLAIALIIGSIGTARADLGVWDLVKGMPLVPIEVTSEMLESAIDSSNPAHLKLLLTNKSRLKADEKKKLLRKAIKIAQEARRGISLFKSPWDLGRFICGSLLFYHFTNNEVFADNDRLKSQETIFKSLGVKLKKNGTLSKPGATRYSKSKKTAQQLKARRFLDTCVKYFGLYWAFRGYFCVSANKHNKNAQHVVELLENTPEVE